MVLAVFESCAIESGVAVRSTANDAGKIPIRISMMSPMPFCPSFEPWAKLTPVQVKTSRQRRASDERAGEPDPEHLADERVRGRRRQAQVPGAEVPDDGGQEKRRHHQEARSLPEVDQ